MTGYWWCEGCKEELPGTKVTYQERCESCGNHVEWFDLVVSPSERISELEELVRELVYEFEETIRVLTMQQWTKGKLDVETLASIGVWSEVVTKAKRHLSNG